jgi:hypothetical protein
LISKYIDSTIWTTELLTCIAEVNGNSKFPAPKELPQACSIMLDFFVPNSAVSGSYKIRHHCKKNIWKLSDSLKRKLKEVKER